MCGTDELAHSLPTARAVRRSGVTRLIAGGLLAGSVTVLGIAWVLPPDPRGLGTHRRLGSGPCGLLVVTGQPCPTCGMTTAYAHFVRGQWGRALWVQPAGFVLALATAAAVPVAGWALVRGRWPRPINRTIEPTWVFVGFLALMLAGWAFKMVAGRIDGTLPYR